MVLSLCVCCSHSGFQRSIQLHFYKNTIENIIRKFDYSHLQFVYDGSTILCTYPAIEYANKLVSVHNGYYDNRFRNRFIRIKDLKLCALYPMGDGLNLNINNNITINSWHPTAVDEIQQVKREIQKAYRVDKRYITHQKPFRILYSRIPDEFDKYNQEEDLDDVDDILNYIHSQAIFGTTI